MICDEDIDLNDEHKSYDEANFNEKEATCETQNLHVLFGFLLITIALLIAV